MVISRAAVEVRGRGGGEPRHYESRRVGRISGGVREASRGGQRYPLGVSNIAHLIRQLDFEAVVSDALTKYQLDGMQVQADPDVTDESRSLWTPMDRKVEIRVAAWSPEIS